MCSSTRALPSNYLLPATTSALKHHRNNLLNLKQMDDCSCILHRMVCICYSIPLEIKIVSLAATAAL